MDYHGLMESGLRSHVYNQKNDLENERIRDLRLDTVTSEKRKKHVTRTTQRVTHGLGVDGLGVGGLGVDGLGVGGLGVDGTPGGMAASGPEGNAVKVAVRVRPLNERCAWRCSLA